LEKELGFDIDYSFGETEAMSGGKRTRRANMKYSETEKEIKYAKLRCREQDEALHSHFDKLEIERTSHRFAVKSVELDNK
jgi:hypothetical protein